MALAAAKQKKCKNCRAKFTPWNSMQVACSPVCALDWTRKQSEKAARRRNREAKQKLKTRRDWEKEAQCEFNAFIRERDRGKPCICCGRQTSENALTGGKWDAGHYRSVGSAPHLRFNEDNCHRQLKQCNRDRSGNAVDYRIGLISRIGLKRVEALEADQSSPKWTIDDLKAIRDEYRKRTRESRKQREAEA